MISKQTFPTASPSAPSANGMRRNQVDLDRIRLAQSGDLDAFNALILDYQDQVYNHAYWLLGDADAADDAAQEAFYRAYRSINSFDGISFRAWIMRIASNYCLDCLRRSKRHPHIQLETPGGDDGEWNENAAWWIDRQPSPEQVVEQADRRAFFSRCLLALAPNDRAPILLVDLQGMEYQEAADILSLPLGSFKSRLSRARRKLLCVISQAGDPEPLFC